MFALALLGTISRTPTSFIFKELAKRALCQPRFLLPGVYVADVSACRYHAVGIYQTFGKEAPSPGLISAHRRGSRVYLCSAEGV
jgi:hypothetical protein